MRDKIKMHPRMRKFCLLQILSATTPFEQRPQSDHRVMPLSAAVCACIAWQRGRRVTAPSAEARAVEQGCEGWHAGGGGGAVGCRRLHGGVGGRSRRTERETVLELDDEGGLKPLKRSARFFQKFGPLGKRGVFQKQDEPIKRCEI